MSTFNTTSWTGTYSSYSRRFRGYMTYTWEPQYSNTQSRLTITAAGVEKITSGATTWEGGNANIDISPDGSGSVSISRNLSSDPIAFDSAANSRKKLSSLSKVIYYNRGTSAATKYVFVDVEKTGNAWAGGVSDYLELTVPAKPRYAVTYNANGGSGTPGTQTKWYGTALTLSATKPTRTGYTFLRWSTNAAGTGTNYAPGASYTGNAALTLYAIWQINTYAVTYNANGGSGSISDQTKTYGSSITLSNGAGYSREFYDLTGWNTAPDGSGSAYALSGSYTANAAVTMYAQWRLAYVKPEINAFRAYRTDTDSVTDVTESDDGSYIRVSFDYICGQYLGSAAETSCVISIDNVQVYSGVLSSAFGTFTMYFGTYDESVHSVSVRIYDIHYPAGDSESIQIATATFPLDFLIGSNDELCMGVMTPAVDGQPLTLAGMISNGDVEAAGEIIDGHGNVLSEIAGGGAYDSRLITNNTRSLEAGYNSSYETFNLNILNSSGDGFSLNNIGEDLDPTLTFLPGNDWNRAQEWGKLPINALTNTEIENMLT